MDAAKLRSIAVWVLRILTAAVFGMAGAHKLLGDPMMTDMFGKIGFGQGFRYLTGAIEVAAALLVLWPRTTFVATMLMLGVLVGAFATQLFVLHGDVIHVIVIAAAVGLLAWLIAPRGWRRDAQGA